MRGLVANILWVVGDGLEGLAKVLQGLLSVGDFILDRIKIAAMYGIMLVIAGAVLLTVYGVVVIVFRSAYGVELPNPFDWIS